MGRASVKKRVGEKVAKTKKSRKAPPLGSFVAISDLHAHPWSAFAKGDGLENTRLQRSLGVLRQSLERALQLGVPWVFAGDIVHTAGYALNVVLSGVTDVLAEYPSLIKIVVWGNHDARGVGARIKLEQTVWKTLLKSVDNLYVLQPGEVVEAGGLTFAGEGSQPKEVPATYTTADVGVYHGIVKGSTGPNGFLFDYGIDPEVLMQHHRVAVVGDLHHPQFQRPTLGKAILVPGSPEHHNFGDAGKHGFWIVTVSDVDVVAEFENAGSPHFLTVDTPADVCADDGNFYRVRDVGLGDELPESAMAIAPSPTTVQSRVSTSGMSDREIIQAWMRVSPPPDVPPPEEYFAAGVGLLSSEERVSLRWAQLRKVRIKNFGSYAEEEFLVEPGVHLVMGKGKNFQSNGAGKTTLFESVFWLFTGRTTKGLTGADVLRWGTEECCVEGTVELLDGTVLTVKRSRGEKGHTLEMVDLHGQQQIEASSVNEATKKLCRYFGFTPELIQAMGYFSQVGLTLFSAVTDSDRKGMVDALIGLDAHEAARAAASARATAEGEEEGKAQVLLAASERTISEESEQLATVSQRSEQWEQARIVKEAEAVAALSAHDANKEHVLEHYARHYRGIALAGANARKTELEKRSNQIRCELERLGIPSPGLDEQVSAARAKLKEAEAAYSEANASKKSSAQRVRDIQARVTLKAQKLATGICPECEQEIDEDHRYRCTLGLQEELRAAITEAADAAVAYEASTSLVSAAKQEWERVCEAQRNAERYQLEQARLVEVERDLLALGKEQEEAERAVLENAKADAAKVREDLVASLRRVEKEQNPYTAAVEAGKQRIEAAKQRQQQYESEVSMRKKNAALYGYWAKGFSRQGIQSLLLDEVAAVFNAARGSIFPALTQGVYDAQLSTQSRTRKGEVREKTEILVREYGKPVPYESLSGGERRRIDVGVMLTLVKAVSSWMRVPGVLGWMVLDEVFSFLDASGAEGLAEVLREIQEVVPSLYVVTHDPQLQALFSKVLLVERAPEGYSRIVKDLQ